MAWEDTFKFWGSAPSETEQKKMDNAEAAVKKAINADAKLAGMDISIITQGSYKNRTNVRQESDVDICVCLNQTFFARYPTGKTREDYGHGDGSITHRQFRDMVHSALANYFKNEITAGDKAIHVHSNTYRVDVDVLPALAQRHYYGEREGQFVDPVGAAFDTNEGKRIINWPHQWYANGVAKQDSTGQRYKKMVRIVKRLRDKLQSENVAEANDICSSLIESLVWNVPDAYFNHDEYKDDVHDVLAHTFNETLLTGGYATMKEVNGRKDLFATTQPWTREQAHAFLEKAWSYLGFA